MTSYDQSEKRRGLKTSPDLVLPDFPALTATFPVGDDEEHLVLFRSPTDPEDVIQVPFAINRYLRPYQRQGVKFLFKGCFGVSSSPSSSNHGVILADDMGLGKTIQIIALLSALLKKSQVASKDQDQCRRVKLGSEPPRGVFLIVAPLTVMYNWEEELETWGRFLVKKFHGGEDVRDQTIRMAKAGKLEVVLTTYETVRAYLSDINSVDWDAVIADEVHKLKGGKAKVSQAFNGLRCRRRIGLTGTVIQNRYEELWHLLNWANPGCLGSLQRFKEVYASKIKLGLRVDASKVELATSRRLQKELDEKKSEWVLRRTKGKTIADQLPKKTDRIVYCPPSALQSGIFDTFRKTEDMAFVLNWLRMCDCGGRKKWYRCCHEHETDKGKEDWGRLFFMFIHLFLKTANHVALLDPTSPNWKKQSKEAQQHCQTALEKNGALFNSRSSFLAISDPKYSGKMQVLVPMLEILKERGDKVLLFSYSTRVLSILETFVQSKGYEYRRLDGQTNVEARTVIVKEFNDTPELFLFLISTKAGGLGLNITGANVVIIFDPNWNPSHDLQAQDRAFRLGQRRDVTVYRLITAGSIEENIYLRQVYKQQLGKNAVDGENARRYFTAVQGQAKGELFGVPNLFKKLPCDEDDSLTSRILNYYDKVEELVRGKKVIKVRENMLELEDQSDEEANEGAAPAAPSRNSYSSVLGGFLDEDLDGLAPEDVELEQPSSEAIAGPSTSRKKKSTKPSMDSLFRSNMVVSHHANQDLIGGSRVEDHISKCALKSVEDNEHEARELSALQDCGTFVSTQTMELGLRRWDLDEEVKEEEEVEAPLTQMFKRLPAVKLAHMRSDEERIFKSDGSSTFLYGQSPSKTRDLQFEKLSEYLGLSPGKTAEHVLSLTAAERARLLQSFYLSLGYTGVEGLYDNIISEILEEEEEEVDDFDSLPSEGRCIKRKGQSASLRSEMATGDLDGIGNLEEPDEWSWGASGTKKLRVSEGHHRTPSKPAPADVYKSQSMSSRSKCDKAEESSNLTNVGSSESSTGSANLLSHSQSPSSYRAPKPAPDDVFRPRYNFERSYVKDTNSTEESIPNSRAKGSPVSKMKKVAASQLPTEIDYGSLLRGKGSLVKKAVRKEEPETAESIDGEWGRLWREGKLSKGKRGMSQQNLPTN